MLDFAGGRTRTRTWDPLIKSQLLYQLSYAPENAARPKGPGPVAKRVPTVQGRSEGSWDNPSARPKMAEGLSGAGSNRISRAQAERELARDSTDVPLHHAAFRAYRTRGHFTHARRGSTKGKPPGGDPAAPVRRRSCRGAGSATAGARLGYMVTTGVLRQGVPFPSCPYRNRAHPIGGASFPRARGTRRGPVPPGG